MYQKIVDNFVFNVGIDSATLMGWDANFPVSYGSHKVPTLIDGKPVVAIADKAFECTYIEHLDLPASITIIGKEAFRGSNIKHVMFYTSDQFQWQPNLKIGVAAFKDCILLESFFTMQVVEAEYLSFCGCPKLKDGAMSQMYFSCIHPEAFASTPNLKVIHIARDGWIQARALQNSSIVEIHIGDSAKIPEKTLDYIKKKGIELHIWPNSPMLDLAYEGICIKEALPF